MARILNVDDEPLTTEMMDEWLSELDHVAVPAHNLTMELGKATSTPPSATCRSAKTILIR